MEAEQVATVAGERCAIELPICVAQAVQKGTEVMRIGAQKLMISDGVELLDRRGIADIVEVKDPPAAKVVHDCTRPKVPPTRASATTS